MTSEQVKSIADPSQPNAGRIYDYLLGGHHNFEVDRQTAEMVKQAAPHMPQVLRLIRWFLGAATRKLVNEGLDIFVDFASGLPTLDHIHQIAPPDTRVLYSDIDPVTVEYAHEILADLSNVRYARCDAATPEVLLESDDARYIVGTKRRVAIGMNGIAWFLPDEKMGQALQALYAWAGEGSRLFLCDADADPSETTDDLRSIIEIYKSIGQPIYLRRSEKMLEMASPWRAVDPGPVPLHEWIGVGDKVTDQEISAWGGRGFYGVVLEK